MVVFHVFEIVQMVIPFAQSISYAKVKIQARSEWKTFPPAVEEIVQMSETGEKLR